MLYETIPSLQEDRFPSGYQEALTIADSESGKLPQGFPLTRWNTQWNRYREYWSWFDGTKLAETLDHQDADGNPVAKYPLAINMVRTFSRRRAAVVLGESPDNHLPLVRTVAQARRKINGGDPDEESKKLALSLENVINEVWMASDGRSMQYENAVMSEFLGGAVVKVKYVPWEKDLVVPVCYEQVIPDHFLPVWNPKKYSDLLEVYEVYRIPSRIAAALYPDMGLPSDSGSVIYVEHWHKDHYSIYVNGKPLVWKTPDGERIKFHMLENPFGFCPYVYLPAQRDGGSFYGPSLVPDIKGIMIEYNARMADNGDAIRETIRRRRYMRNATQQTIREVLIGEDTYVIDLGVEPPHSKHPPEIWTEDPPKWGPEMTNFTSHLWSQGLREGALQSVGFGEDEGSQRSALTLAFRMWPTTAKARVTRTFWTDGLNRLAMMTISILEIQGWLSENIPESKDWRKRVHFDQDWHPMIPRDREQEVNEVILMYQSGLMSPERALETLGGVKDINTELDLIKEWLEFQSSMQPTSGESESTPKKAGSGSDTSIIKPQAQSVDKE